MSMARSVGDGLDKPPPAKKMYISSGAAAAAASTTSATGGVQTAPTVTVSIPSNVYCECFAHGEFCIGCKCQNCHNNLEHEAERREAIQACLDRNPYAFHPKISSGSSGKQEHHVKGCHCRRSSCLKNYCECFEAGIPCSQLCKCLQCKNYENNPDRQALMDFSTAGSLKQGLAAQSPASIAPLTFPPVPPGLMMPPPMITMCPPPQQSAMCPQFHDNVAVAASQCLLQRAELIEQQDNVSPEVLQQAILEEAHLCLQAIAMRRT